VTAARGKPLPDVDDPVAAPFWRALRERRVELQHCGACGHVRWTPARVCPECLAEGGEWRAVTGAGTIYSYAVYERALHPAFAADVPYTVLAVTLDAGPLMIGALTGADAEPDVGARVEPVFDDVAPAVTLLRFRVAP
jgi:uncharacterized OB-fold protein